MKKIKGFTLVEILVALSVGLIVLGAVYVTMISGHRSSTALQDKIAANQDVRAVLEVMATEISMASYNPNWTANMWVNPGACAGAAGNQSKGIQAATPTSITVEMDINGSSTVGDSANEIIAYIYDSNTQTITRQANCLNPPGPVPFLGGAGGSVNVINSTAGPASASISVFRYFDGRGTEILPTGSPLAIPAASVQNIRRIEITLAVQTQDVDPNTNTRRSMIYSTSVIPRNHTVGPW